MAKIRLSRTVYKKDEFDKSIDSSFKSFVDIQQEDPDTIEELFRLYNKFYAEIPAIGASNSHEFLVKESSKFLDFENEDSMIQPLLDEISDLRLRLLQQNVDSIETENDLIRSFTNDDNNDLQKSLNDLQTKVDLSVEQVEIEKAPPPVRVQTTPPPTAPPPAAKPKRRMAEVSAKYTQLRNSGKYDREQMRIELLNFGANEYQINRVI